MTVKTTSSITEYAAIRGFYTSLAAYGERNARGAVGETPRGSDLELVDGWVVWKGRPVWCAATGELVNLRPPAHPMERRVAPSAEQEALEQRLRGLEEAVSLGSIREGRILVPPAFKARLDAEHAYYDSLGEQARRAMRGEAALPVVPPRSELEFVNGWLVWKGRPVWWSGQRQENGRGRHVEQKTSAADAGAAEPSVSTPRPKRRRLVPLPWRRAA